MPSSPTTPKIFSKTIPSSKFIGTKRTTFSKAKSKAKWYRHGLAFACAQCGNCCSGPATGFVWVTKKDIEAIAGHLHLAADEFQAKFVRRVGSRYSLIEQKPSNDCIFLDRKSQKPGCQIYPVRPVQCRTWPFWTENLRTLDAWNETAQTCPGINRGKLYNLKAIEAIRHNQAETTDGSTTVSDPRDDGLHWIVANLNNEICLSTVAELYHQLDEALAAAGGICRHSGKCCNFDSYGHRLYVTTLEMLYFLKGLQHQTQSSALPTLANPVHGTCPYQIENLCTAHAYRPIGCRIFYCQGLPDDQQNQLTEQSLRQLRSLHQSHDAPYHYTDWLSWLEAYRSLFTASLNQKQ